MVQVGFPGRAIGALCRVRGASAVHARCIFKYWIIPDKVPITPVLPATDVTLSNHWLVLRTPP